MTNREFITEYANALNGQAKTPQLIRRYVSDPVLIEHIEQIEAAFPRYEFAVGRMVCEGDWVALMATFRGVHRGEFAGIAATGRAASAPLQIFYRVQGGKIVEHHLQFDAAGLLAQLRA